MLATVLPLDAFNKGVSWSVSNSSVATINAGGILTAISNGVVVVKATAKDASGQEGSKSITISGQSNGLSKLNIHAIGLYPNPIENLLYIQADKEVGAYHLYSIYGKWIETGTFKSNQKDLSGLETGVYILHLNINEDWVAYKIIKK
jgi:hypothetical protein